MEKDKKKTSYEQFKEDMNTFMWIVVFLYFFVWYKNSLVNSFKEKKWVKFSFFLGILIFLILFVFLQHFGYIKTCKYC
jgi:Na+-driven multidrug efflux pump